MQEIVGAGPNAAQILEALEYDRNEESKNSCFKGCSNLNDSFPMVYLEPLLPLAKMLPMSKLNDMIGIFLLDFGDEKLYIPLSKEIERRLPAKSVDWRR